MGSMTFVVPVPEGKVEEFRKFAHEAHKDRRDHHHATRQKHGYTKEKVWLHSTPGGYMLVAYLEGKMPEAHLAFMKSKEPHDVWMKEAFRNILGIEMDKNLPPEGELVMDYEA
jgi:hypothetical protein